MQEALFNSQWYRVEKLHPRTRPNVVSHRHQYRGAVWYIVGARSGQSHLRINAAAFYLFTQFDGERTVDGIWREALSVLGDDAPTQDEMMALLGQLFDEGLIDFQQQSDVDRLFENLREKQQQRTKSRYGNPLFLRFALFDPDRLARSLLPIFGWLFSPRVFHAWVLLIVVSAITVMYSWTELSVGLRTDLVSPKNLVILWCVFPLMKLLHELAHALAVRRWGGEVHEFGVAFLVLLPVPYVDASDSASFSSKYRRMAVAGAGIVVESTLACLGLFVWLVVEPGLIRDIAFNVMLTGGVSSLLFNGNPLLKFDSYYVLSDLVEIPSLASRSHQYVLHLCKRYLFGVPEKAPVTAKGEPGWLLTYSVLSTLYRLSLTAAICLFVASHYFFIGVGLALWALAMQVGLPVFRAGRFLLADPRLGESRVRALAAAAFLATPVLALLFMLPMTNATHARGVVWPIDEALVRARTDCLVEEVLVANGTAVEAGAPLVRCDATMLEAQVANLQAEELAARASLFALRDRVDRGLQQIELDTVTELLAAAQADLTETTLTATADGRFFAPGASNLAGRHFGQGEVIGYVLNENNIAIRAMLGQERVALIGDRLDEVEVRAVRAFGAAVPSRISRRVPAATERLVTPALSVEGGGDLLLHPDDTDGSRLRQPAFELEVELPEQFDDSLVGDAVDVRFDHGSESIAAMLYRELRLLFLRQFNV